MELSKRLQAVADLITEGLTVADVGTDHGYIPIYLVETKKCRSALAMDVNRGPLLRAREHIEEHGLSGQIETRLSDGVRALRVGECDCVVVAGMGGALTIKILEEGRAIFEKLKEFILQPQSELSKVRKYLYENGYQIIAEDMVLEDGKFYPMMKVVFANKEVQAVDKQCRSDQCETMQHSEVSFDMEREVAYRYGKLLLENRHPILKEFLEKEVRTKEQILHTISMQSGLHIEARKQEIQVELEGIRYALQNYYGCN